MVEAREFLTAGLQLHGHRCPAMPLGLRAGALAMNRLGVPRSSDGTLLALVELGDDHCAHCYGDGVQMVTGCTFGKGNIRKLGHGKFGLTLVDRTTNRAVRVVPRAEAQLQTRRTAFFQEYRMKGVPASKVPEGVVRPLIEKVMTASDEALFTVGEVFDYEVRGGAEEFGTVVCDRCGELVIESYARVVGERTLCIPCQEALQAAP